MPDREFNHYFRDVRHLDGIDVYRVCELFGVTHPALQHAVKKLLVTGGRSGGKSFERDLRDVIASCQRALEMNQEDQAVKGGQG